MKILVFIIGFFSFIRGGFILPIITILLSIFVIEQRGKSILISIGRVFAFAALAMSIISVIFRLFSALM